MDNRFRKYAFSIAAAALFISFFFIFSASAQKNAFQIDTDASCVTSSCHADMGKKKYVHEAAREGTGCALCHEVLKPGEHSFKEIPPDVVPLCAQCHSEEHLPPANLKGAPKKVLKNDLEIKFHKPFSEGKCTECHDPHESDFYKHLKLQYPEKPYTSFSAEQYSLCYKCHNKIKEALTEPRTLTATSFRNGNLNLHFRHVNRPKGRVCSACHIIHGSRQPKFIRETFQFGDKTLPLKYEKTETGGSCAPSCHAPVKYDRCEPEGITLRTTPREGDDADVENLKKACEK